MEGAKKSNVVRKGTSVLRLLSSTAAAATVATSARSCCGLCPGWAAHTTGMRAARALLKEVSVIRWCPPRPSGLGKVVKATAAFLVGSESFRPDRRSVCRKEPPLTSGMAHVNNPLLFLSHSQSKATGNFYYSW